MNLRMCSSPSCQYNVYELIISDNMSPDDFLRPTKGIIVLYRILTYTNLRDFLKDLSVALKLKHIVIFILDTLCCVNASDVYKNRELWRPSRQLNNCIWLGHKLLYCLSPPRH